MNVNNNSGFVFVLLICLGWPFNVFSLASSKNDSGHTHIHVYFNSDSYKIISADANQLNQLAQSLKNSGKKYTIRISGNCDSTGSDTYNDKLSLLRANAIKDRLIQAGVHKGSIEIRGYGKRKPINKNKNPKEWQENRRVDIEAVLDENKSQNGLNTFNDKAKTGTHITLKAMDFEGGMHHLLPAFLPELDSLVQIMQTHPTLEIKILGYVCCTQNGMDGTDLETGTPNLSTNRAKAVYDYLIKNKISKTRLSYQGMGGRNKIVNPEITEEDKTLNRRVEIVIMKQ